MWPSKKQLVIFIALTAVLFVSFIFAADARELEVHYPDLPGVPPLTSHTTLPQLLNYFFRFFVMIGGLIAFGSIVFAGFLFMTSGANPGLRAKAMGRVRQAMLGLVLLLSTYIILNTINPELVFLREPGRDLKISKFAGLGDLASIIDTIDYDTLRYGGVVVFDEPDTSGAKGRSETIFHNVDNFEESTYINSNSAISAIKILGACSVEPILSGIVGPQIPFSQSTIFAGENTRFNDKIKALRFGKKDCLGHSVKVFENKDYNAGGVIVSPRGGTFVPGAHTLLTNIPDLSDIRFMPAVGVKPSLDNIIRSIKFAIDPPPARQQPLAVQLCDEKGYKSCMTLTQGTSTLSSVLDKKISSIQFTSPTQRQAGVIVYRDANFKGFHEIFIASDKNLNPGIVNGSHGSKEISSFQIIGNYKVTFYEKPSFEGLSIAFDNTNPKDTLETSSSGIKDKDGKDMPTSRSTGTHIRPGNAIFRVPSLSALCLGVDAQGVCNKTLDDKVSSIKIEITTQASLDHNIICSRVNIAENLCEL